MRFADRGDAGRALAAELGRFRDRPGLVVLGLPRGGVPVAREVAVALTAPLDVFVVRKLGVPGQPELAFGAVASGGVRVLNPTVVAAHGLRPEVIERVTARESAELQRREELYRAERPAVELAGATVLLVDDGLATGATMRAAAEAVRRPGALAVIAAAPLAPASTAQVLGAVVDEVVTVLTPVVFGAVGEFYLDFSPTTDAEVRAALAAVGG
jgi:predicted phosphoribosyltransferase